jgi:hypothetical protein
MGGLPGMPTRRESCQDERKKRRPRQYEAELSYIIHEHGIVAVNKWVCQNGTFFALLWWRNVIREWETDERFTNAEQEALWGPRIARNIRIAGHRLKKKLVKAFLGAKLEQK